MFTCCLYSFFGDHLSRIFSVSFADLQLQTSKCYFDANGACFLMNPCLFCRCFERLCLFPSSLLIQQFCFCFFSRTCDFVLSFFRLICLRCQQKRKSLFSHYYHRCLPHHSVLPFSKKEIMGSGNYFVVLCGSTSRSQQRIGFSQSIVLCFRGQDGWHRKQNSADGTECQRCNRFFFHTLSRPQISPSCEGRLREFLGYCCVMGQKAALGKIRNLCFKVVQPLARCRFYRFVTSTSYTKLNCIVSIMFFCLKLVFVTYFF